MFAEIPDPSALHVSMVKYVTETLVIRVLAT